jgi:hypothetical protein
VGLSLADRDQSDHRLLSAAFLGAAVATATVSGGIATLVLAGTPLLGRPVWTLTAAVGICAASSLTLPTGNPHESRTATTRIVEFGALLPIVVGGLFLGWLREGSSLESIVLVAAATGVTLAVAIATSLLLTQAPSQTEERVLGIAALLLVGGVAGALSLSALFGGLVAGVFWRYAAGYSRETITRDVLFVQHPLLVLVLLVAGARTDVSATSLGLGAAYLVSRIVGQLAGGSVASRIIGTDRSCDLGFHLLSPGVFGVAFALSATGAVGNDATTLLSTVVVGTIGSEFVARLVQPRRVSE